MTIFKRTGSPSFYFDYSLGGIRHAGSTKTANRRAEAAFEKAHREGNRTALRTAATRKPAGAAASTLTLGDAMDRLFASRWSRTRDALRVKARGERIVALLGPDTPVASIDAPTIGKLTAALRELGLSEPTVNRSLATVKTLLTAAHREWGVIPSIPFIKLAKESQGRLKFYSAEEARRIVELLLADHTKPLHSEVASLFQVLMDTGCRLMEAVELEPRDVNLENNMIHIWKSKGGRPRSVPMTGRVRALILPRMGRQDGTVRERIFAFTGATPTARGQQVESIWRRVVKTQPGLEDAILHTARHSFASNLVQRGASLFHVSQLLGHRSLATTQIYSHLSEASLRDTMKLLD